MTGYATPGAGPQTGPATLNAPAPGRGATGVDFPVVGSITPTFPPPTYAIKPCVSAPATGDGLATTAVELLPHELRIRAAANEMEAGRSLWVMELRSLTTR